MWAKGGGGDDVENGGIEICRIERGDAGRGVEGYCRPFGTAGREVYIFALE